ncbi:putative glycosyl transferase [Vibrio vulnificus]|uniref:glycosyltransferase n=1 Tax=Vibrio vulnificus TaxID=672 RepID=UPI00092A21F7|nr:glycosyltransferase [Vibrio vulnificus]OJI34898.1 putative glycosyl transferase [Vibrio vulnificus]HAS6173827.1 glycosyltransferase [Vibrio vulnificus]
MNSKPLVSIVIRTLNEQRYLVELLESIKNQDRSKFRIETVIIDSGSTDKTLEIAEQYGCRITHIKKEEFTFGKSLNDGCDFSNGDYLVFISGHCIPVDGQWIANLVTPLVDKCSYAYGRQLGRDTTKFSERQLFEKYFPSESRIPQIGFFCNNANAAIRRDAWLAHRFNEELTGCEDMYLAKLLVDTGKKIGYVSEAPVYHIHDETWSKVKVRYEREAIALQQIMPQVQVSIIDMVNYIVVGILKDIKKAKSLGVLKKEVKSIFAFRFCQYYGAYVGNRNHRKLSHAMKVKYFYPRVTDMDVSERS